MRLLAPATTVARVAIVLLAVGCAAPALAADPALWTESAEAQAAPELARFDDLLSQLAERLKPALVQVRVGRSSGGTASEKPEPPSEARRGTGSGFFINAAGLLVTNAHVVDVGDAIQIRLADGRRFAGKVAGKDDRVDLALVRIDGASNLPVLPLGDSNRVRVGELVLALGHPFGLEQTVSFGIVSRKGAPLSVAAPGFDFIQTDAAINPGNSGGPRANDVVVSFDGTPVEAPKDLQRLVAVTPVGTRVRLGVLRNGQAEDVEVTVGVYRDTPLGK